MCAYVPSDTNMKSFAFKLKKIKNRMFKIRSEGLDTMLTIPAILIIVIS